MRRRLPLCVWREVQSAPGLLGTGSDSSAGYLSVLILMEFTAYCVECVCGGVVVRVGGSWCRRRCLSPPVSESRSAPGALSLTKHTSVFLGTSLNHVFRHALCGINRDLNSRLSPAFRSALLGDPFTQQPWNAVPDLVWGSRVPL